MSTHYNFYENLTKINFQLSSNFIKYALYIFFCCDFYISQQTTNCRSNIYTQRFLNSYKSSSPFNTASYTGVTPYLFGTSLAQPAKINIYKKENQHFAVIHLGPVVQSIVNLMTLLRHLGPVVQSIVSLTTSFGRQFVKYMPTT